MENMKITQPFQAKLVLIFDYLYRKVLFLEQIFEQLDTRGLSSSFITRVKPTLSSNLWLQN